MSCSELTANPFSTQTDSVEYEIFARMPCGLVVINARGVIVWFNEAAASLLKVRLSGARWLDVINQAFSPREDDGHEVSLVDGRRVSVAISSLDRLPGELVTLTDLTTTRDYEDARANQDRLASLGRMTAQLAHQIRTPLSSAILYTEMLCNPSYDRQRSESWISKIQECHASIEQQIQDLLTFARGEPIEPSSINLLFWGEKLVSRARSLVCATDSILTIENTLPALPYELHEESLNGAVLNLLNNALQAGAKHINIRLAYINNETLMIQVRDDGCGMTDDVKSQAFSPFFTTRAQGTGLGLAVVNAVVKAHGGKTKLESAVGKGCCVTITLAE
ncbi:sensor histidine kinase [Legionella sp. CNM-4043-24]|uniref:sensor histidine kinase n=1 Tax=Legionella sp. CNM-4043-24 TaxID=3421646 RepID=UPI00403AB6D9